MRIQLIGFGNVGRALIALVREKKGTLESLGVHLVIVSVSDSKGTASSDKGLNLEEVLKSKEVGWRGFGEYVREYSASDAIRDIESDVVIELTPSTPSGEPGLSHIKSALTRGKNVVAANKGPLVVSFRELTELAERNHVGLLYEATVAAHLPVFCMVESCFKADKLVRLEGILNATTNFIIGEMEKGKDFQDALDYAVRKGWAETSYFDDVNGIDAARKVVILANSFFKKETRLEDVTTKGIRDIGDMLKKAKESGKRVKLICAILDKGNRLEMSVMPKLVASDDPLATVNEGDMALKLVFQTSRQVLVSAQFGGVKQTAYAVLNDIIKLGLPRRLC